MDDRTCAAVCSDHRVTSLLACWALPFYLFFFCYGEPCARSHGNVWTDGGPTSWFPMARRCRGQLKKLSVLTRDIV